MSIKIKREHEIVFDSRVNQWVKKETLVNGLSMRDEPDRFVSYVGESRKTRITRDDFIKIVKVTCRDRKMAEKIAQDVIYKHIANVEGL